uniref:Movement protein n=1 Tax=Ascaris lumbricoides TaxID=6252 RepID=A0A0M3HUI4_ASCLU
MEFGADDYFDNGSGEEVAVIGSASTAGVLGSPSFQQPIKDDADRLQTLSILFMMVTALMVAFVVAVTLFVWRRRRTGSLHVGRSRSPPIIEPFPPCEP